MSSLKKACEFLADYMVERMTEHDLLEVVEIEESCGLSPWGWDGYRGELERPEAIMLVARPVKRAFGEGCVIGFVAARLNAGELHINNIGVRELARRLGIGATLLREALSMGRAYGAGRALLEVRASNVTAQALYASQGFKLSGRRKNYYRAPVEDALVMTTDLNTQA